jgi:hypothetical protein
MSSTLRVSVGRCFDRVARVGVSRARAVAPAALAALGFAARRPVRGDLASGDVASVVLVSVAAVVVRVALLLLARAAVVPPVVALVFDPLLVATANLLARLPVLWRRRRPMPVVYPEVGMS